MVGKKKYAKEPLFYVHQPTIKKPEAVMQDQYFTPKQERKYIERAENKKSQRKKRVYNRNYFLEEEQTDNNRDDFQENVIDNKLNNDKKFKDMTLLEKVYYFKTIPEHAPKVRCEISTEERKYQGIITDYKDNNVWIRIGRSSSSTKVPFDEILSIRMLGF